MPSTTSTPTSSTSSSTASRCRSDWLKAFAKTFDALRETGFDDGVQIVKKFIMQEQQIMDDVSIPITDTDASSGGAAKPVKHKATVGQAKASKNEKKTKRKKPKRKKNKNR